MSLDHSRHFDPSVVFVIETDIFPTKVTVPLGRLEEERGIGGENFGDLLRILRARTLCCPSRAIGEEASVLNKIDIVARRGTRPISVRKLLGRDY
jgi:hypothetical protein